MAGIRSVLASEWLSLASRLILGGVFLYASVEKSANPKLFAEVIHNYHILPIALENLLALTLPIVELGCGVLLIAGGLTRSATSVVGAMLLVFIGAIGVNLIRGVDITCGCFTLSTQGRHLGWITLVSDIVLLLPAVQLLSSPSSRFSVDALIGRR